MYKSYQGRKKPFFFLQKPFLHNGGKTIKGPYIEETRTGFSGCVISDVGCVRSINEDNYALHKYMNVNMDDHSEASVVIPKTFGAWRFAAVFDGMGGGEMGELAAHDTAEIFLKVFHEININANLSKAEVDKKMRKAFLDANNRIIELQQKYRVYGTTGTVACSTGLEFKIYHLGDSRAYLFRENNLFQLTRDQTLAQMKIDSGIYRQNDPTVISDKHKLTEYIGRDWTQENIKPVESSWIPIQSDDNILLCSDGLYDMCADEEIEEILRKDMTAEKKCAILVDKAREYGGEDNITCMLISFTG